jgi:DNA-binding MarR family transcriptional regulator
VFEQDEKAEKGQRAAGPSPRVASSHDASAELDEEFVRELNERLALTYGSIEDLEHQMLSRGHGLDITVSESRLLEAVGERTLHVDRTVSVSQIAHALGIRVPSATSAVNRLVTKGLLEKSRSKRDARRVNVTLTHEGEVAFRLHSIFHRKMAEAIAKDMSPEERAVLLRGIRRLEQFYAEQRETL